MEQQRAGASFNIYLLRTNEGMDIPSFVSLNLYEGRIILPSLRIVRHSRSILQYFDLAKCPLHLLAPSKVYLYLRSIYRQPGIEVYFFLTLLLTFLTSLIRER